MQPSARPYPDVSRLHSDTPAGRRLRILTVEDDEGDAYLICNALADNPAVGAVVHARDGIEALSMIERREVEPDLAFIDLRMPRMDGFDLLVALANGRERGFPMVALTSSAAPGDAVRSRLRGVARVVIKPASVPELYAALKAAIDAIRPRPGAAQAN
jgi:two-component system, LytTR family, response regulator